MPRYIEEETFVNFVQEHFCNGCNNYNGVKCKSCSVDDAISFVESAPTADVVPKSKYDLAVAERQAAEEAIREIFEEIETLFGAATEVTIIAQVIETSEYKALKKKFVPDTNDGDIVKDSEHRCYFCQEIIPQGRDLCGMCETGQEFLNKRKGDDVG